MAAATTISTSTINLSSNDAAVLQAIFDGESATSNSSTSSDAKIDPSISSFPSILEEESQSLLQSLKNRELAIVRRIQENKTPDSKSSLEQAVNELSSLITESPNYPPLYANRAQALRMLIQASSSTTTTSSSSSSSGNGESDQDSAIFRPEHTQLATLLFSDLSQAISLSSPARKNDSVSPAQARLLSNTHTHRGYLLLKAAKIRKERDEAEQEKKNNTTTSPMPDLTGGPEQLLRVESRDQLEEMASQDFFQAGRYGNEVAKQLSVQTNPYAKMCGAIVKEALRKEVEELQ